MEITQQTRKNVTPTSVLHGAIGLIKANGGGVDKFMTGVYLGILNKYKEGQAPTQVAEGRGHIIANGAQYRLWHDYFTFGGAGRRETSLAFREHSTDPGWWIMVRMWNYKGHAPVAGPIEVLLNSIFTTPQAYRLSSGNKNGGTNLGPVIFSFRI